jgi:hypothetical protein
VTIETLAEDVEALLVSRDLRSMASLRPALRPGYTLRAAQVLGGAGQIIIGTGFPVGDTFETDGPLGAIALYEALESLGKTCHIACANPLAAALADDYRVLELRGFDPVSGRREAAETLAALAPDAVLSIERPGLAEDGRYYNMRGEDISPRCAVFDYYLELADCPTIAIGDGGNEIGMGKLAREVSALDIRGAATGCDELLVADVSNWGGYALVALLEVLQQRPLLAGIRHRELLAYLSALGSVDGVTRENTLTEDGLPAAAGEELLAGLAALIAPYRGPLEEKETR